MGITGFILTVFGYYIIISLINYKRTEYTADIISLMGWARIILLLFATKLIDVGASLTY